MWADRPGRLLDNRDLVGRYDDHDDHARRFIDRRIAAHTGHDDHHDNQ
jgi:hypothetical protein